MEFFSIQSNKNTLAVTTHAAKTSGGVWVIFSHGFTAQRMGPSYLFVKISRMLEHMGISSCRFDFAGSGESTGLFSEQNISSMLGDLEAVYQWVDTQYSPEKIILIGHSLGGAVAALSLQVLQVNGCVLLSPVARPAGLLERRKETVLKAGVNARGFYENGPHEMSLSFVDDLTKYNPLAEGIVFNQPLLVLHGDADESIELTESALYPAAWHLQNIDNTYCVLPGADHNFSTVRDVELVLSTISSWMKERFL